MQKRNRNFILMASNKTWIGYAGIHVPDHRMNQNLVGSYMSYIKTHGSESRGQVK